MRNGTMVQPKSCMRLRQHATHWIDSASGEDWQAGNSHPPFDRRAVADLEGVARTAQSQVLTPSSDLEADSTEEERKG